VHFYSKFWRKSRSNRSSRNEFLPERDVASTGAPGAPAPRRTASPRPQARCAARGRASLGCGPLKTGTHAEACGNPHCPCRVPIRVHAGPCPLLPALPRRRTSSCPRLPPPPSVPAPRRRASPIKRQNHLSLAQERHGRATAQSATAPCAPPQLSHRSTLAHHWQIARCLSLGRLGAHPAARCPDRAPASPEAGT
jgi:hypothetical protein